MYRNYHCIFDQTVLGPIWFFFKPIDRDVLSHATIITNITQVNIAFVFIRTDTYRDILAVDGAKRLAGIALKVDHVFYGTIRCDRKKPAGVAAVVMNIVDILPDAGNSNS